MAAGFLSAAIGMVLIILGCGSGQAAEPLVLKVGNKPRQEMKYGLDFERLWFWPGSQAKQEKVAQWAAADCDIDFIRVAMNCAYELKEGEYDPSAYTKKILPMMKAMQAANPKLKYFASPRPLNEAIKKARWQPYPRWITGEQGKSFDFDWKKCAEYLLRYLELMHANGFAIHYLDVTNEWNFVKPEDVKKIRSYLSGKLPNGVQMPLLVAPSSWSFEQGAKWLSQADRQNDANGFDIAASHNTGHKGTPQDFADAAAKLRKEVWDTEVHGWKGKVTKDEIPTSKEMFDRIRAGFTGLSAWLAIGTPNQQHCFILNEKGQVTRNVKYFIFQKLANTSNHGYALDIDQPGALTSTAALVRGNLLTVWALNNSASDVPIQVELGDLKASSGAIAQTLWNRSLAIEGVRSTVTTKRNDSFAATVPANSLGCYEISLARAVR